MNKCPTAEWQTPLIDTRGRQERHSAQWAYINARSLYK